MTHDSERSGPRRREEVHGEQEREAQAVLDQIRHQAGGALSGREILRRLGKRAEDEQDAPPLDWRMTPKNIALQILAIAVFVAVVYFMGSLFFGGIITLFTTPVGGS